MAQVPIFWFLRFRFNEVRADLQTTSRRGASVCITLDGKPLTDLWADNADRRQTPVAQEHDRQRLLDYQRARRNLRNLLWNAANSISMPRLRNIGPSSPRPANKLPVLLHDAPGRPSTVSRQGGRHVQLGHHVRNWRAGWWTPERHSCHAITYGWLVGELVRRVTVGASADSSVKKSSIRSRSMRYCDPELDARIADLTFASRTAGHARSAGRDDGRQGIDAG
jgi:hypothetical protein